VEFFSIVWDDEPGGNVEHIAEHGLTPDEVDAVLNDDSALTIYSHSSGRPGKFGYTPTGKYIVVVWDELDHDPRAIYPVTACEVPEPPRRKRKRKK
jgi:uncharacterized DUF497 family protein